MNEFSCRLHFIVHSRPSKYSRPYAVHQLRYRRFFGLNRLLSRHIFSHVCLCLSFPDSIFNPDLPQRDRAKHLQSQHTGFADIERPQMIIRIKQARSYILAILLIPVRHQRLRSSFHWHHRRHRQRQYGAVSAGATVTITNTATGIVTTSSDEQHRFLLCAQPADRTRTLSR